MTTTVTTKIVNLTITTNKAGISPTAQRGSPTFNSPLIPQPPSLLQAQNHPDPLVRELVTWASALSIRLQELLDE